MKPTTCLFIIAYTFANCLSAQLMSTASGTEGVAPFGVHFNALNPGSGVIQPPPSGGISFSADFQYEWDFGDPLSGNWPSSGRSRNHDIGFVSGHVYENPGNYTVTLTVTTTENETHTYSQDITVQDPDLVFPGNSTICVSTSGNFTGAPSGALLVTTSDFFNLVPHMKDGKRILLRRGEQWYIKSEDNITLWPRSGPFILGAFGASTGRDEYGCHTNAPIIEIDYPNGYPTVYEDPDNTFVQNFFSFRDFRNAIFTGIHIIGNKSYWGFMGGGEDALSNLLLYQIEVEGFRTPVGNSHWNNPGNDLWMLVSSKIHDAYEMVVYTGSERLLVMGNAIYNSEDTHILRVWQGYLAVISHNLLHGSSLFSNTGRHALKFHGPQESELSSTTETRIDHRSGFSVVHDNIMGTSGPWPVVIGPQDEGSDERLSHVIFERNRIFAGYGTMSQQSLPVMIALQVRGDHNTIRNNIIDGSRSSSYFTGISVIPTVFKNTEGNRIVHNTIVKNDYQDPNQYYNVFTGVAIEKITLPDNTVRSAIDTHVQNNLSYINQQNVNDPIMIMDHGLDSVIGANLLSDIDVFVDINNPDPIDRDFRLRAESDPIDAGTLAGSTPTDFDGIRRPHGLAPDLGAFEYVPANNPPFIAPLSNQTIQAGTPMVIHVEATDSDPDAVLQFSASGEASSE